MAVDGYEGITADQLTSDLFSKKNYQITNLQKERKVSSGDPVYKLITSETWSVVIPLSTDQIVSLAEKKTIRVKFLKDDATQTGLLTIVTGEDGNYYGKITFSRGMIRYSGDRFLNIELVTNTQTGLKIPLSSIVKKNFYVIPKEYLLLMRKMVMPASTERLPEGEKMIPLNLSRLRFIRKTMITIMWIWILFRTEM